MLCADAVIDMVYALGLRAGNKLRNRLLILTMRMALSPLRPAPCSPSRMSAYIYTLVHTGASNLETRK